MTMDLDPLRRSNPELSESMDIIDELLFSGENLAVLKEVARAAKEALEAEGIDRISKDKLLAAPDGTIAYAQLVSEGSAADDRIRILFVFGSVDQNVPVTTTTLAIPPSLYPMQERGGEIRWITDDQVERVESDPAEAEALGLDVAAYRRVVTQVGGRFGYDVVTGFYKAGENDRKQYFLKATESIARNQWRVRAHQAVETGNVGEAAELARVARGVGTSGVGGWLRRKRYD